MNKSAKTRKDESNFIMELLNSSKSLKVCLLAILYLLEELQKGRGGFVPLTNELEGEPIQKRLFPDFFARNTASKADLDNTLIATTETHDLAKRRKKKLEKLNSNSKITKKAKKSELETGPNNSYRCTQMGFLHILEGSPQNPSDQNHTPTLKDCPDCEL